MYVDYAYYVDTFHGSLSEEEFNKSVIIGQSYVDRYTRYTLSPNLAGLTEEQQNAVKNCICELAEIAGSNDEHYGVTSESVGEYSVSYRDANTKSVSIQVQEVCERWLGWFLNVGLGWV